MNNSPWHGRILFLSVLLVALLGCGPAMPVGGIIEVEDEPSAAAPADAQFDRSERADDSWLGEDGRGDRSGKASRTRDSHSGPAYSRPSDTQPWGSARKMPSDSMPSRTENWGTDRKMPSKSMPSNLGGWGAERSMPSDSMPSNSGGWGAERSMPSDSMPSGGNLIER